MNAIKQAPPWTFLFHTKGGHRYYRNSEHPDLLAVADDSIRDRRDPGSTDDGLIVVNRAACLEGIYGAVDGKSFRVSFSIPCFRDNDPSAPCSVGADLIEAGMLARKLGVPLWLSQYGHTFKVTLHERPGEPSGSES
jgi:hypothetical protein